ncbi:MFS general substrate transporter [Xylaria castorea]|nr:MFS general substrate transporter [Xylaria castorea]
MLPNLSSINMPQKIEADNEGSIEAIPLSSSEPSSEPSPLREPHALVDEGKLLRKIDLHVLPILFIVYVAAFIDRVNISSALTLGLSAELGLVGQQPNVALTIFFVPYILFEIPSNILMKRWSPRVWLSGCILVFGVITIGQGFVQSYSGLLTTRFLLGLAESGIFPGSFYLISFWYRREESLRRFTFYWSSTIIAGAFGGLLATAITNLDGVRGLSSWRWIFVLEGLATVLIGIVAFFAITEFPKEAKWLSSEERAYLLKKTGKTSGTYVSHSIPITIKDVVTFLSKPKHWVAAIMYFSLLVPSYSFVFFIPTIVQSLGYSTIGTQLHSVPPFAAAFGFAVVTAYASDKLRIRSPFILLGLLILITGLSLLISVHGAEHFSIEYAGLGLSAIGTLGIGGNMVCWYVMNLRGHQERSIGSAWLLCVGNLGGIVATFSFLKSGAPYYHTGYSICLATSALCVVMCACYAFLIWRERNDDSVIQAMDGDEPDKLYL